MTFRISSFPWTDELDADLLRRKAAGQPWTTICPAIGCSRFDGQERHSVLTSPYPRQEVRVAKPEEPAVLVRDGLAWLIRKNRLNPARRQAALAYQAAFRGAGEAEASIKSSMESLMNEVHTAPRASAGPAPIILGSVAAKRDLFAMRFAALRGQADMLSVMDGVCGIGWSLRELAGGNQHRAKELEMALLIALDLIIAARKADEAMG